jgi:nicotinamide riboside transporter PnuC
MNSPSYIAFNLVGLVLGQWLVTRGHWTGFLVWCACNVYGVVVCIQSGIPETSCLFGAYFLVNACSLRSWFAKARQQNR